MTWPNLLVLLIMPLFLCAPPSRRSHITLKELIPSSKFFAINISHNCKHVSMKKQLWIFPDKKQWHKSLLHCMRTTHETCSPYHLERNLLGTSGCIKSNIEQMEALKDWKLGWLWRVMLGLTIQRLFLPLLKWQQWEHYLPQQPRNIGTSYN